MIFISIAAYRDTQLVRTLEDCLLRAQRPGDLHIAVLDQGPQPLPIPEDLKKKAGRFSYLHLHHQYSRGPCWARSVIASMLRDERFLLQLDSHMRFEDQWDQKLLNAWHHLSASNPKAIISSYPCSFSISNSGEVKHPMPGHALVLRPKPEARFNQDSPILSFYAIPTLSNKPIAGFHVGAGCIFSPASLFQEVPADPWLYFHGEEQNIAVRAWTHGWDIWHIPDLPIFHLYNAAGDRPVHWSVEDEALRNVKWWELNQQAVNRMSRLLFARESLGVYGLGSKRTLEEFAIASGIDYVRRSIGPARSEAVRP